MSKFRQEIEFGWFQKQRAVRVISSENLATMGERCWRSKGWPKGRLIYTKPMNDIERSTHTGNVRAKWFQYKSLEDLLKDEDKMQGDTILINNLFKNLFQ